MKKWLASPLSLVLTVFAVIGVALLSGSLHIPGRGGGSAPRHQLSVTSREIVVLNRM